MNDFYIDLVTKETFFGSWEHTVYKFHELDEGDMARLNDEGRVTEASSKGSGKWLVLQFLILLRRCGINQSVLLLSIKRIFSFCRR